MNNIADIKEACTGCENCAHICPVNAISMRKRNHGFLYAIVNKDICVTCGKCRLVCPQAEEKETTKQRGSGEQTAYIVLSKDKSIWKESASGGAFATMASSWLKEFGGYISGAAWLNKRVEHIVSDDSSGIRKMQNSKYVQSLTGDALFHVKKLASDGKRVLFSGTPCQCASLCRILNDEERKYVLIIDIICHGVPSMEHLKTDISLYGGMDRIDNLVFRSKQKNFFTKSSFAMKLIHSIRTIQSVSYDRDPFFNLFMQGKNFRPSCYECRYANLSRMGDITIGDCDSHHHYKAFYQHVAVSTLIINSELGRKLWNEKFKELFYYTQMDLELEQQHNHQLMSPIEKPEDYENIMNDFDVLSVEELVRKYARHKDMKYRIMRILYVLLPDYVIHDLHNLLKKESISESDS